jgi:dihydrofolate synthase/folylpolyglutamate synthase
VLQETANKYNLNGYIYNSVTEAYQAALKASSANDFIYVGGSTFVVAEIL